MRRLVAPSLILWLATAVRLWGLDRQSLWLDETFSRLFATLPNSTAWQALLVDGVHPPLYYYLLRLWILAAGDSAFALRFMSVIPSVLTVALVFVAASRWLGRRAGMWAALLLAVNPLHVWYSQEARMYGWLGLLWLGALLAFWQVLETRRPAAWAALMGVSAAAYATHYFALYLPLIEFVFILATFRKNYPLFKIWIGAQAVAAIPLAGWLIALFTLAGNTFGIGWITRPGLADLFKTLWSFGMAYDGHFNLVVVGVMLVWGLLLAVGVMALKGPWRTWLVLGLALPLAVTFLLSMRRPTYVDRFLVGCLSSFILLAVAGLMRLPNLMRAGAMTILVAAGLFGLARFQTDPAFAKEDWRGAISFIQAQEQPSDVLSVRIFQFVVPFLYYYHGKLPVQAIALNQTFTPPDQLASGADRLWMVFRSNNMDMHHLAPGSSTPDDLDESEPRIQAWLASHKPIQVRTFPGLVVMLFAGRGSEPIASP